MATSFDNVIDMALITVNDYKLTKLYDLSQQGFLKYCDGLLISAIPNFFQCRQSLKYDTKARMFEVELSALEISILADLWVIAWMTREIDNSSQFQAKLQNSGSFKNHSEAQNLKEKTSWLDRMRERVYQKITEYQLQYLSDIIE